MINLTLTLSVYLKTILKLYEKEGFIELNKFIVDSIKNHIDYEVTGQGGNTASQTVNIEVLIPILLALKLWWKVLKNKTSISIIVNEALSFSTLCLIEQIQALEDCRLEMELEE